VASAPLQALANVERHLPAQYISADGFGISDACRRYLQPLIVGEAYPPYRDGLPHYVQPQAEPLRRRLTEAFTL